jgi:hypothetical protein
LRLKPLNIYIYIYIYIMERLVGLVLLMVVGGAITTAQQEVAKLHDS